MNFFRKNGGVVTIVATFLCVPCPSCLAQAATSNESFEIHVDDADVAKLAQAIASHQDQNIIIRTTKSVKQQNISETYRSWQDFLGRTASRLDGRLSQHGVVSIIRPKCSASLSTPFDAPASSRTLSLSFGSIDLQTLFEILEIAPSAQQSKAKELKAVSIALATRSIAQQEHLSAIADSVGLKVITHGGKLLLAPASSGTTCAKDIDAMPVHAESPTEKYQCQAQAKGFSNVRCDPLETYRLESLTPQGYVQMRGAYIAVIKAPDDRLYLLKIGDRLGQHGGRVMAIDAQGVKLQQTLQDSSGVYQNIETLLFYGKNPEPTPYPVAAEIKKGDPLERYFLSIGSLYINSRQAIAFSDRCKQQFPDEAFSVQDATNAWIGKHTNMLVEIKNHIQTLSPLLKSSAETSINELVNEEISNMGGPNSLRMRSTCEAFPVRLQGPDYDMEKRFAVELGIIRSCKASSVCPNLQ